MGTGVHLTPTGIEFDERRLTLGKSTEVGLHTAWLHFQGLACTRSADASGKAIRRNVYEPCLGINKQLNKESWIVREAMAAGLGGIPSHTMIVRLDCQLLESAGSFQSVLSTG